MKKSLTILMLVIGSHPASAAEKPHRKGCNTKSCDRRVDRRWGLTHKPMHTALASWYYQSGLTACGYWGSYSVAHKTLPCNS
ncbi:MAG TPA: hypothetical protein VN843_18065, partial [Anaerolineales bacterium]|nr:hypothetical protein [Anaerolineales bacterium]